MRGVHSFMFWHQVPDFDSSSCLAVQEAGEIEHHQCVRVPVQEC